MTKNYNYEIKSCKAEEVKVYKDIFSAFGHTGSILNLSLTRLEEEEAICSVMFMVGADKTAQIMTPTAKEQTKEMQVAKILAVEKVIKSLKKNEVTPDAFITPNEDSKIAGIFGFTHSGTEQEVSNTKFYEFTPVQRHNEIAAPSKEDIGLAQ